MLLNCRVYKGVRRFGDSFLEDRRRVAPCCDRLSMLGAPGCQGPGGACPRHQPEVRLGNLGDPSLSRGHGCVPLSEMGLPVGV